MGGEEVALRWSLRAQAIGRKNSLFVGSCGVAALRRPYSTWLGAVKRHTVDPFDDLRDVLEQLSTHPADRLADLWPDVRIAVHPRVIREIAS